MFAICFFICWILLHWILPKLSYTQGLTADSIQKVIFNMFIAPDGSNLLANCFVITPSIQGNLLHEVQLQSSPKFIINRRFLPRFIYI